MQNITSWKAHSWTSKPWLPGCNEFPFLPTSHSFWVHVCFGSCRFWGWRMMHDRLTKRMVSSQWLWMITDGFLVTAGNYRSIFSENYIITILLMVILMLVWDFCAGDTQGCTNIMNTPHRWSHQVSRRRAKPFHRLQGCPRQPWWRMEWPHPPVNWQGFGSIPHFTCNI